METYRSSSERRVPVRVRRIVGTDGAVNSLPTVFCPARYASVPLAACGACGRCQSITEDGSGAVYVSCHPDRGDVLRPELPRWLKAAVPRVAEETPIAAIMATDVLCVTAGVSVEALAALFLERSISAAPVVDAEGHPIGMVSKTDLVRDRFDTGAESDAAALPALDADGREVEPAGFHLAAQYKIVSDVMMPIAFTLQEHDSLAAAADLMAIERVHHVPVVSSDNRVVGIVSSLDFARWLAREAKTFSS